MLKFYNTITKASARLMFKIIILSGSSNRFSLVYQISSAEDFADKELDSVCFLPTLWLEQKSNAFKKL